MSTKIIPGISTDITKKPIETNIQNINSNLYIPKQYKEVAENMESQFAEAMLNQMNQTTGASDEEDTGMNYYKSLETSERAKMMSKQNNLGLQPIILDQIYPKRLRTESALKQYESQANAIHQKLPSYKTSNKNDTIKMGKNDSSQQEELQSKTPLKL